MLQSEPVFLLYYLICLCLLYNLNIPSIMLNKNESRQRHSLLRKLSSRPEWGKMCQLCWRASRCLISQRLEAKALMTVSHRPIGIANKRPCERKVSLFACKRVNWKILFLTQSSQLQLQKHFARVFSSSRWRSFFQLNTSEPTNHCNIFRTVLEFKVLFGFDLYGLIRQFSVEERLRTGLIPLVKFPRLHHQSRISIRVN